MTVKKKKNKPQFFMVGPWRFKPTGTFYFRFYGPHVKPWGWYQAGVYVKDPSEGVQHFREWVADTKEYINELSHQS
jgi:hypothetical protein